MLIRRRWQKSSTARRWSTVPGIALAGLLSTLLVACQSTPPDSASISIDEKGELLVGSCRSISLTEFYISATTDSAKRVRDVQHLDGLRLEAGDVLPFREVSAYSYRIWNELLAPPGAYVHVYLYGTSGTEERTVSGDFTIPDGGLRPGRWLFSDGSGSDRVCGAFRR